MMQCLDEEPAASSVCIVSVEVVQVLIPASNAIGIILQNNLIQKPTSRDAEGVKVRFNWPK